MASYVQVLVPVTHRSGFLVHTGVSEISVSLPRALGFIYGSPQFLTGTITQPPTKGFGLGYNVFIVVVTLRFVCCFSALFEWGFCVTSSHNLT